MLLDTSGLLCYLHQSEPKHQEAVQLINNASRKLWTHSYVLAELIALALVRRFPRQTVLAFALSLVDHPDIETVWVDKALHQKAMGLLLDRPDKSYSLCDAVSFVLMQHLGLTDALTTDQHFVQEGFVRLLAPSS